MCNLNSLRLPTKSPVSRKNFFSLETSPVRRLSTPVVIRLFSGIPQTVTICVELLFEVNTLPNVVQESGPSTPPRACVEVVNGTNAHDILKEAANQHPCYNFTVNLTSYGRMIKSICNVEQKPAEKFYWMIYINGKPATVGIDDLQPNDGSTLGFHYKQLNWG